MKYLFGVILTVVMMGILIGLVVIPAIAQGGPDKGIPTSMSYQGYLTDDNGDPVPGPVDITFTIYTTGGTPVWAEKHTGINPTNGLFSVELGGNGSPMGAAIFDGDRFLGVKVSADPEMNPRQKITSVSYALVAEYANTANSAYALDALDGDPQNAVYVDNDGDVGIGTINPDCELHIKADDSYSSIQLDNNTDTSWTVWSSDHFGLTQTTTPGTGVYMSWTRFDINESGNAGFPYSLPKIKLYVGGTIVATGLAGIGTDSPLARLHVQRNDLSLSVNDLMNDDVIIEDSDAVLGIYSDANGSYGSAITIGEISSSGTSTKWGIYRTTSNASPANQLRFSYGSNNGYQNNPTIMALDQNGNVGIGTTSPGKSLHINGDEGLRLSYASAGDRFVDIYASGSATSSPIVLNTNSGFEFQTDASPRLTITEFGMVGIGTTSADRPLTIEGTGTGSELISLKDAEGASEWHINLKDDGLNFVETGVADGRLYLEEGGNIGIGTMNPESALQVEGYIQLDTITSAPPAADCDEASECGRMKFDHISDVLYICSGVSGWVTK